jgi:hypothetical protein
MLDYSEFTIYIPSEGCYYGDCSDSEAVSIAYKLADIVQAEYDGINTIVYEGESKVERNGGADIKCDEIGEWVEENWLRAVDAVVAEQDIKQRPVVRYRIDDIDGGMYELISGHSINDAIHKYVEKYHTGASQVGDAFRFSVWNIDDDINRLANIVIYSNGQCGYRFYETEILSVEE